MLASFLLSLREGLEIALIIGIVLGALRKLGREEFVPTVRWGVGSAIFVSLLLGLGLNWVGATLEGDAEVIFEGFMMLFAAAVLTWMIFWMKSRAARLSQEISEDVSTALEMGRNSLFLLSFVVVVREGIELALFLSAALFSSTVAQTIGGAVLGLALAAFLGWLIFATTVRLNLAAFFRVTSILLIFFAAGLVAHGIHEFNEIGWIPGVIEHVWDVNHILDENSFAGQMLKTLFGYNGNPSLTEVAGYALYFVTVFLIATPRPQPVAGKQSQVAT